MPKPANTILVIGGEPHMRRFIRAGLERHDYSIHETANGATFAGVSQEIQPDIIVLDLDAPTSSGADVREVQRSWSDVPIIVLAAQSDDEQKARLIELGVAEYMIKPIGVADLAARCEAASRDRRKAAK
jgi:two-component system KDP operon response regulator KdpE